MKFSSLTKIFHREKTPEQKQHALNIMLYNAVSRESPEEEVKKFIAEGAQVNAPIYGKRNGEILAVSVYRSIIKSYDALPVIKLLYQNGAKFEDAQLILQGWGQRFVDKMNGYKQQIEGAPAVEQDTTTAAIKPAAADKPATP